MLVFLKLQLAQHAEQFCKQKRVQLLNNDGGEKRCGRHQKAQLLAQHEHAQRGILVSG